LQEVFKLFLYGVVINYIKNYIVEVLKKINY